MAMPTPWLYILVSLLFIHTPVDADVDISFYKTIDVTYIPSAVQQGAVCLDGSPPAYHIDRGEGDGVNNWILSLEGGGWCNTPESCLNHTFQSLGSSKFMQAVNFTGILADQQQLNPYFYNWNRVFVRYCDGGSFTGDRIDPVNKLHYKGAKIFDVVVKELLATGMNNASNALISGCSAGGLAAILNCDKFRYFLPIKTNVRCASDAGYFVHAKDVFQKYTFAEWLDGMVNLHGSIKNLPKSCTSKMKPQSLCFYPQYIVPFLETPLFLINSAFDNVQINFILAPDLNMGLPDSWKRCKIDTRRCSTDQVNSLKGFRREFLGALPEGNGSFRGMFINTCLVHCQSLTQFFWNWDPALRLGNKTIAEALGSWSYGNSSFRQIDYENDFPKNCNPLE